MHLELYELYNKRNHNQLKGQDLIDKLYETSYCDDVECQVYLILFSWQRSMMFLTFTL